jgi:hypothetical protein
MGKFSPNSVDVLSSCSR